MVIRIQKRYSFSVHRFANTEDSRIERLPVGPIKGRVAWTKLRSKFDRVILDEELREDPEPDLNREVKKGH